MKVHWDDADVTPGTIVGKPGCNEFWMIGWIEDRHARDTKPEDRLRYTLNSLADGMVLGPMTKLALTAMLNADYQPAVLLATPRE